MRIFLSVIIITFTFFSGCTIDVKPLEKETLAKETMKDSGMNPLTKKYEEHMYFSKEASRGGAGVSGGGCGCN